MLGYRKLVKDLIYTLMCMCGLTVENNNECASQLSSLQIDFDCLPGKYWIAEIIMMICICYHYYEKKPFRLCVYHMFGEFSLENFDLLSVATIYQV